MFVCLTDMAEPIQQLSTNNQGRSHREQIPFTLLERKEKVSLAFTTLSREMDIITIFLYILMFCINEQLPNRSPSLKDWNISALRNRLEYLYPPSI